MTICTTSHRTHPPDGLSCPDGGGRGKGGRGADSDEIGVFFGKARPPVGEEDPGDDSRRPLSARLLAGAAPTPPPEDGPEPDPSAPECGAATLP